MTEESKFQDKLHENKAKKFLAQILSFKGTYGRRLFLLNWILALIVIFSGLVPVFFLEQFLGNNAFLIFFPAYLLGAYINICGFVKRLHDLGRSGYLWLLTLVPLVNVFLILYLIFARGKSSKKLEWNKLKNIKSLNGWQRMYMVFVLFPSLLILVLGCTLIFSVKEAGTISLIVFVPLNILYFFILGGFWVFKGFPSND